MKLKGENMKTTKTLIAATLGLALFAGAAYAQFKATGDDGITASPKLREMLTAQSGIPSQPALAPHGCATCKDEYTTRVDATAKGLVKPTVLTSKHLCPTCKTTASVQGQGKAAQNVAEHKCTAEAAACCAPKI